MRMTSVLTKLLGIEKTRVTGLDFEEDGVVLRVKSTVRRARCGSCIRRSRAVHDRRTRRWRHQDMLGLKCVLEAEVRRVRCRACGVTTELVPWAEHVSNFTFDFERTLAFLAQRMDKTSVAQTMRVAWETVGVVAARVVARLRGHDLLDGLVDIGIDEISWPKRHHYVTVVVDHTTGRIVWAAPGRNADTVRGFFHELGIERSARIRSVSLDMSEAYQSAVRECCPNATIVFDRFHVQRVAHDALDSVRRQQMRSVEGDDRRALKRSRFALQKNPWNTSDIERAKLSDVQRANKPLYRAYLLKETRAASLDRHQPIVARKKLGEWIAWANRPRLAPLRQAAGTIKRHIEGIAAYVATGLSNGRTEGLIGKARTITKRSFGFHSPYALIGLIMLCCSGLALTPAHRVPVLPPKV